MAKVLDIIRMAINDCEESRYNIAKATGIAESQLSRLMSGETGLNVDTLEKLAAHLGLEIIIRPKRRQTKGK